MLKKMTALFFFVIFLSLTYSYAYAALIQLKNGQKIEGNFVGASAKEIRIEVASQTLKLKVSQISHIIFDTKSFSNFDTSKPNSFKTEAKKTLRVLKAIRSVIEGGVNYREYGNRVNDAKIKVDEFLDEYDKSPNPELNSLIADAMGYYGAAANAWSAKITKDDGLYISLPHNPYCKKCKPLQTEISNLKNGEYMDGGRSEGMAIGYFGIQPLWQCAEIAISRSDKILKK